MTSLEAAKRILDLDKEAAPGPWENEDDRVEGKALPWRSTGLIWSKGYRELFPFNKPVAQCVERNIPKNEESDYSKEFEADASFIAETRTLAPSVASALIEALKLLKEVSAYAGDDPENEVKAKIDKFLGGLK